MDRMIVTASLNGLATEEFLKSGKKPDFNSLASAVDGVNLVRVFGRSRYADLEVSQPALQVLREKFGNMFIFAEKQRAQPF